MINQQTLEQIAGKINATGIDETTVGLLRSEYGELHFTHCDDDDIPNNEPALEQEKFNLYLIDGREHCLCLTDNFDNATGIVVAEIYQY